MAALVGTYALGSYIEFEEKWLNLIVTTGLLLIILYDLFLFLINRDMIHIRKTNNDKVLVVITAIAILLFSISLGKTLKGFIFPNSSNELFRFLVFEENKMIALTMFYRIFGFAYVAVIMYMFFVFEMLKELYKNRDYDIEEAKYILEKYSNWKKLILVILVGVMLSFLHFAELDFRISINEAFQMKFDATREVYHLIATAIFIPLFFDLIRNNKEGGENK